MFWRVDRLCYCPPLPDSRDQDGRTGPLRLPAPNIDTCHHCFWMLSDGIMLEHFHVPVWPHVASTEEMERRKRKRQLLAGVPSLVVFNFRLLQRVFPLMLSTFERIRN